MISALSHPEPGRRVPLFSSREHQDAQELFQLVSEYIKKEATAVDREGARDLGLGALASLSSSPSTAVDVSKGVFDGLTANRRSCCECGYTEAVMHFPFDNWQLTVPRVVRPFPLSPAFSF
jgi:ubiquitin carboxyl-terminal hydrolase 1